ncbi:MAG: SDR family oxidoreductase [Deltaproteobacteria bacterium]|nr:SDR family oxidoreductase [Deltaproteobacteria bacterium]
MKDNMSIHRAFFGKHLLVTGGSGFVGKVWISMILSKVPEIGKIYVLVRNKKNQTAFERFEEMLSSSPVFKPLHEKWGDKLPEYLHRRLEIVEGDVSLPGLGIPPDIRRGLEEKIDLVVNCAGLVDFEPDLREAIRINAMGAIHALEFTKECRNASLLHISTAFVCGKTSGGLVNETLIPDYNPQGLQYSVEKEYEDVLQEISTEEKGKDWVVAGQTRARKWSWPNGYTYSKSMAESLIQSRAGNLRFAILRPSIVESALSFPFPGWNEGAETCTPISYLAGSWLRHITARPKLALDIVPVDLVGRGITLAAAALLTGREFPVYHCASSDRNLLTVGRMLELIDLAHRKYYRAHGKSTLDRMLLSRWDAVPVGENSPFSVTQLRKWATSLTNLAKKLEGKAPESLKELAHRLTLFAHNSKWTLIKAEKIIQVFLPFIHDNDFRFVTKHLAEHEVEEMEDFGFEPEKIHWREYVIDIHEPGIRKWCYPILEHSPVEKYTPPYSFHLIKEATKSRAQKRAVGGRT